LSLFSFRVIVILLSYFSVSACASAFFNFLIVSANSLKQFLSGRWLCKLFDNALFLALARGALAKCLQYSMVILYKKMQHTFSKKMCQI